MPDLYNALIAGVDAALTCTYAVAGGYRACVGTELGTGCASLLLDQHQPLPASGRLERFIGQPLAELAVLCKSEDRLEAAIGVSALNACYNTPQNLLSAGAAIYADDAEGDVFHLLQEEVRGKKVATIGHFFGVRELLAPICDFYCFERQPEAGDLPEAAEESLLPQMDLVFITGMTLTNHTLPRLLLLAQKAQVILTGPSVPLAPIWYSYGVSLLSGFTITEQAACRQLIGQGVPSGRSLYACGKKVILRREMQ